MDEPRKKPTPRPDPPPPLTDGLEPWPPARLLALATFGVTLGVVLLIVTLAGGAPPPPRVHVDAPAWMLTPVPTVDIGIPALHVWDCVTEPATVCTDR